MSDYSLKVGENKIKAVMPRVTFKDLRAGDMFAWRDNSGYAITESSQWRMKLSDSQYIQLLRNPHLIELGSVEWNGKSEVVPLTQLRLSWEEE